MEFGKATMVVIGLFVGIYGTTVYNFVQYVDKKEVEIAASERRLEKAKSEFYEKDSLSRLMIKSLVFEIEKADSISNHTVFESKKKDSLISLAILDLL